MREIFLRNVNVEHHVVKLLNGKGVDENSIFSIQQVESEHTLNVVAIKLIKPDGRQIKLNVDSMAVITKSGNVVRKNIVIPGLEIGDILDYYVYLEIRVLFPQQFSRIYDPVYILPQGKYPVLDYNLSFTLGPSAFMNVSAYEIPDLSSRSV